jgi:hypothetical protein
MKAERRHELQTNVLADWLGKHIEQIQPHSTTIFAVIVAACVVIAAYFYFTGKQTASAGRSWEAFYGAVADNDVESLLSVSQRFSGTDASLWSQQFMADMQLGEGASLLFRNRKDAESALKNARENYESILKQAAPGSLLQTRARFGLAQTFECLGDIAQAKHYYEMVAASDAALREEAGRCVERLSSDTAVEWYEWFAAHEPRFPSFADNDPSTGTPGSPPTEPFSGDAMDLPNDLSDLPDRPDLSLPGTADPSSGDENKGDPSSAENTSSQSSAPDKSQDPPAASRDDPPSSAADRDPASVTPEPKPPAPDPTSQTPAT